MTEKITLLLVGGISGLVSNLIKILANASICMLERAIRLCESRPEEESEFWWNRRHWILADALYLSAR